MKRILFLLYFFVFSQSVFATVYYVDVTTGSDSDDGLSEGDAWQTIGKAMDTIAAGDFVWVKGSASYTTEHEAGAIGAIKTVGTASNPIVFEGYSSTTGDGTIGTATLDTGSALTNCINSALGSVETFYTFRNFRFTGATGAGVDLVSEDDTIWTRCRFDNNGAQGLIADDRTHAIFCQADLNSGTGFSLDAFAKFVNCASFGNSGAGINVSSFSQIFGCLSYENSDDQINIADFCSVINCTVDGDNSTQFGIDSAAAPCIVINSIIFDCSTGIDGSGGANAQISLANLFFSNTTDVNNWPALGSTDVTADPLFDSALPYRLQSGSPALAAGLDSGALTTSTLSYIDIGAIQREAASGTATTIRARRHGH